MTKHSLMSACLLLSSLIRLDPLHAQEEYEVVDITAWSEAQLASLPYFDRYVPLGVSGDFHPVARSGFGVLAGNRDFTNGGWVQGSGAFLKNGTVTDIPAWRRSGYFWSYSWSRTWFDGKDVHFQNGFVTHSPVRDINALGQVVGYATVPGSGDSSNGYDDHAYLRDTSSGTHFDLTPEAHRADPRAINDLGEIAGIWSNAQGVHPFRRSPDGTFTELQLDTATSHFLTPSVLNNRGQLAGDATVYTVPDRDRRPFFSGSGSETERLPLPSQNSPDAGSIADINEHGVLVGKAYRAASPVETNGVRWRQVDGNWEAEDLNELLADHEPEIIIDQSIAINDAGHIIARGHLDGTDTQNTRTVLLTPDEFPKPAASTLTPGTVGSTSAVLRGKVNACGESTSFSFQFGTTNGYGITAGAGSATGTAPVLPEVIVTGLTPNTLYHCRIIASNSKGQSAGRDLTFRTRWDWPSWSSAMNLGSPGDDLDQNGLADLIDYATGGGAPPFMTLDGDLCKFSYRRARQAGSVLLSVETSQDLREWEQAVALETIIVPEGPDQELVTFCFDASPGQKFARLTARIP